MTLLILHLELFAVSDTFFSIWLNEIPTQMIVNLQSLPTIVQDPDSTIDNFYTLREIGAVLAIRKLEFALRLNRSTTFNSFPRQQNRRFPYYVKSPSLNDDFIFYTNILPIDIEHIPFDITKDSYRATYQNVPTGPNYTHFHLHNTLKAVDNDQNTCWQPLERLKKGDFFAIDFLRIQPNNTVTLIIGHSQKLQNSLDIRISFDGIWWISYRLSKGISIDNNEVSTKTYYRLIIDSRQFPSEFQTFRYIAFNSTDSFYETFKICDIRIIKSVK